jgi:hypothetical protein
MRTLAVWLLLAMITSAVLGQELVILELRHRTAEEMVPLLQPLLGPQDTLVPHHTQLIIKASPATLGEIRTVLDQLDRRPHRLRISVQKGRELSAEALNGGIVMDRAGGIRGHVGVTGQRDREQADQFVQTIDGQSAMIETGEARPMAYSYGYGAGVTYQPVTTGFNVTPRLTGRGEVRLGIEPWSGQFEQAGRIDIQSAATQLLTPLGVWIEIGGLNQTQTRDGIGHAAAREQHTRIFVKVDDLDAGME